MKLKDAINACLMLIGMLLLFIWAMFAPKSFSFKGSLHHSGRILESSLNEY